MKTFAEEICCSNINIIIDQKYSDFIENIKAKKAIIYPKSLNINAKADIKIAIDDGENAKDINNVLDLVHKLYDYDFDRGDYLIAIGGGTVLDLAGFVASIYMRGVNLVNIPTSLLGMVDAAIGGKNGVNFGNAKNILGTYYQPSYIVVDLDFLDTLPIEEIRKGIAEVIKYGIILDKDLYDFLSLNNEKILNKDKEALSEIITKSIQDKLNIVKQDERETKGIRVVLNFGHTVGHAIEAGSNFKVSHGYAISLGMVCESKIAEEMGYSEEGVVEDSLWILDLYGLPISPEKLQYPVSKELAISAVAKDKKIRNGEILMPVPTRIGDWKVVKVPVETMKGFISQCL
ncbi:3-dehydroquinate synthase [Acidianus sulfidivorans JP7]|uniref:3-dehydroquinate synthase n=1 Tax=Acidianus sulfidivorans JP7 TaxID=619593 RepID=A0A2U9INS4_9CREN|nr:3-dehydroquinate synthase [Acidianus sulfidivorans]AWR97646.1 3-dehydroquinate synthase [Acidianus sulfidivorans JP7]